MSNLLAYNWDSLLARSSYELAGAGAADCERMPLEHIHWPGSGALLDWDLGEEEHECLSSGQQLEASLDFSLEQLSVMITARLEQALQFRRMEEQLAELTERVTRLELEAVSEKLSPAWSEYLLSLLTDGPLKKDQAVRAINLWASLQFSVGWLTPPHASPLEDGRFAMAWDKGQHHFEIELQPEGLYDWFYLDRSTDQIEGEQGLPVGDAPGPMIELLRRAAL